MRGGSMRAIVGEGIESKLVATRRPVVVSG